MGKQAKQRRRRSASDLQPVLDQWEPAFEQWRYAGRPEQMRKYFYKGEIFKLTKEPNGLKNSYTIKKEAYDELKEINKTIGHDYFQTIPPEVWYDPEIIQQYGKNLRAVRKQKKLTAQEAADAIGIHQQNLSLIENGSRKKIDRNILVLLCGCYQTPPEFLLGLADPGSMSETERKGWTGVRVSVNKYIKKEERLPRHSRIIKMTSEERAEHPHCVKVHESKQLHSAMEFYTDWSMMRCKYILDQLSTGNQALLKLLIHVADCPGNVQRQLLRFLENMPGLHMMRADREESMLQAYQEESELRMPKEWWNSTHTIPSLTDLQKSTPKLLSAYVSIASQDAAMWDRLYQILDSAGFGEI